MLPTALAMCVLASAPSLGNDDRPAHQMGARGELGFGASTGMLGAVVWRDLAPAIRAEGGAGMGLSGLQLSALLKLVAGGESHRFVAGAGVSLGLPINGASIFKASHEGTSIAMPWLNLNLLGYEYMSAQGWTVSLELGATTPLRGGHWDITDDFGGNVRPLKSWYPGGHVGFGKSF